MTDARATIRVGCSGWNYRHWRGAFYPDGLAMKNWFAFYAEHFDTVEINNSFYRLPPAATFDKWRQQAPAGFRYAVKANRFITQAKKLKECEQPLLRMIEPTLHLGPALGPILYQLPPMLRVNLDRLEAFLSLLPPGLDHVFEFREQTWHDDATLALLDRYGAGAVAHDFPGTSSPRWASGNLAYVRFHGGIGKYYGRYPEQVLRGWAEWMLSHAEAGRPVWAYFNNDIGGAAIEDARVLSRMVRSAAPRAQTRN